MDTETELLNTLLWLVPWVLFAVVTLLRVKDPPPLGAAHPAREGGQASDPLPHVTVIVPARNEALNIEACVSSVLASTYANFDLIVLDDRSTDGTAEQASAAASKVPRGEDRLTVIPGAPLPPGWFGKPWACHQASEHARGDILLFTDADTRHDPELLGRSVASLDDADAHALTLIARQLVETFWERVVQPHVFFMIAWRYGNMARLYDPGLDDPARWREAIANGQFIMIRREDYDAIGGHEAVRGDVVEDLRLAQEVVKSGRRLAMRDAQDVFATRMYRSLGDLAEGWTKNLWTGARQAFGHRFAAPLIGASVVGMLVFWVLPPVAFGFGLVTGKLPLLTTASVVGLSVVFWCAVMRRVRAPVLYGVTYPLGALVMATLLARSALRGRRIEWKGRKYGGESPTP